MGANMTWDVVLEVSYPDGNKKFEFGYEMMDVTTPDAAIDRALSAAADDGLLTHSIVRVRQQSCGE